MKLGIKIFAVCSALTMIAPIAFGATNAELQTQITNLLAQIQNLQNQLTTSTGTTTTTTTTTFTSSLTVGSRGAEVTALQSFLISSNKGVKAQALAAVGATGYFGVMTQAAVAEYQAAVGISPAVGYFGPITRAYINSSTTSTTSTTTTTSTNLPAGCTSAVGYSSTTGQLCSAVVTYPAGCTSAVGYSSTTGQLCVAITSTVVTYTAGCTSAVGYSQTTGQLCVVVTSTPTVITTPTEGSIAVTYAATPINNLAVNRGENIAVMGINIKATGSDMKVTRLWLDINTRIWLSADSVSLLDGSTVLATLPLSATTVTEVTAGSAYQLQFNGLNFVVPVGTTKVLTVKVSRPAATVADTSVIVATTSALRAIDGVGITDTYLLGQRNWNLAPFAATAGTLSATLNASSPAIGSVSGLSTTAGVLTPVRLMDFDLKATSGAVNVTAISGTTASTGTSTEDMASLELRDGITVLSSVATNGTSTGTFAFSSLNIDIPANTTKTLSIWAQAKDVNSGSVIAGDAINVVVNSVTGTSGTNYTTANSTDTVTGAKQSLYGYAPTVAFVSASTPVVSLVNPNASTTQEMTGILTFTIKANGQDEYVTATAASGTQGIVLAKQVANGTPTSTVYALTQLDMTSIDAVNTGGVFMIPNGATKTFAISYKITVAGANGYNGAKLNQLWLTANTNGITSAVDFAYALPSAIGPQAYINN